MSKRAVVLAVLVVVLAGTVVWRRASTHPAASAWQGWVEGDYLFLGPDEPGRLVRLDVKEGDRVAAGAPLYQVQSDLQDADLQQAKSAVAEAEARLQRLMAAQQRPEEIAVLEAQRTRAEAALLQSKPELERAQNLVDKGIAAPNRLDTAKAAFDRDQASLAEVNRQIAVAKLNARQEDIDAARKVVEQANARLSSAQTRVAQRRGAAPAEGTVQDVFYRPGELVPAGRPVVSLLPPSQVKLRFFVPQATLPKLALGERVAVSCDGCAADIAARVSFISTQAEFTPPVIFSPVERDKLVFRIEARPERPELLRVGQPVTVSPAAPAETTAHDGR